MPLTSTQQARHLAAWRREATTPVVFTRPTVVDDGRGTSTAGPPQVLASVNAAVVFDQPSAEALAATPQLQGEETGAAVVAVADLGAVTLTLADAITINGARYDIRKLIPVLPGDVQVQRLSFGRKR